MQVYLVGTDSVHATAAVCDYLERRGAGDGKEIEVIVVAASGDEGGHRVGDGEEPSERDAREALNVARVRLPFVDPLRTEYRDAALAPALAEVAAEHEVDEVIVGRTTASSEAEANGDGSTGAGSVVDSVLEGTSRPVVVVPVPDATAESEANSESESESETETE
ncbi:Universal stress protein family protein [Halobiforma haloterrestris]|uniref:Universal stress protein family protein n=1 Tax=Natronobacterium haloterrestre TaxID=148448 RepID=A0A1I1F649_NATHA|nr:universal stress protein [Halobiforma haloterrestris]SFB92623.1 Universal stress protein family protein [Halobiforma haloterrestris]